MMYVGKDVVPQAAESVAAARATGMRVAFVTNNASRRAARVAEHLTELGIPAAATDVITSAEAIVHWLTDRLPAGSPVLVVGSQDLSDEMAAGGFAPQRTAEGAVAVVQGLDQSTDWGDLAEASVAILGGALWVAGNRDSTYPSSRGPLPGNGAMVQALVEATGLEPVVVGKPEPELHRTSVERVSSQRPLVVGDRLDTDVLGAVRAGVDCLLVMTGVTDEAQLLAAPAGMRPTYVSSDLAGLTATHEQPVVAGDTATCGADRAWYDGEVLQRSGSSDDALRAACALAWSRHR
ncbi:MAG: haloacid dehalogenase [Frankiales bacterium]|nr:haloacid dehalogenase [Frankiales bacterium]